MAAIKNGRDTKELNKLVPLNRPLTPLLSLDYRIFGGMETTWDVFKAINLISHIVGTPMPPSH